MIKQPRNYREAAIHALHAFVGGDGKHSFFPDVPTALMLPHCRLAIAAGDEKMALDPYALRSFALRNDTNVVATWVDPMLSGHAFEVDVVMCAAGEAVHYQSLRLWMANRRGTFLLSSDGKDIAIEIHAGGVRPARRVPHHGKPDLLLGFASGQSALQTLVYGGSPYATPHPQNLGR